MRSLNAIDRLAQMLGCQYLSDLHYITLSRKDAEDVLARLDPPMTTADYRAVIQYLTYDAGQGDVPDERLAGLCAELLSSENKQQA